MSFNLALPVPSAWSLGTGLETPSGMLNAMRLILASSLVFTADANTKLLLHLDGTNGSTTFIDSASGAHTVTPYGTCALSTSGQKVGSACAVNTGVGYFEASAHTDWSALAAGDWTVEFWIYFDNHTSYSEIFSWGNWGNSGSWLSECDPSGNVTFYGLGSMSCNIDMSAGWHYYTMVKNGGVYTFYWDGIQKSQQAISPLAGNGDGLFFGSRSDYLTSRQVIGRFDEVRVSSIARYLSSAGNFTLGSPTYNSSSPVAESPWIAIAGNTINDVATAIVIWENSLGSAVGAPLGTVTYDYALNGGAYTGTFVSQATMLAAIRNTTVTDHSNSIRIKAKFTSDGTQAADITGGYLNVAAPSGGGGSTGDISTINGLTAVFGVDGLQ